MTALERATESTMAKAVLRLVLPILLSVACWSFKKNLDSIELSQREQKATLEQQGERLQELAGDVRVLTARIDVGVVAQITSLERRVESLEQSNARLRREASVH